MSRFQFNLGQLLLSVTLIAIGFGGLSFMFANHIDVRERWINMWITIVSFAFMGAGIFSPFYLTRVGILAGAVVGWISYAMIIANMVAR